MQKKLKWCLAGAILLAAITSPALAHSHPGDPEPTVSGWAQGEVTRARELGLISDYDIPGYGLPEDYRAPITRGDFRMLAMRFVALLQHCDSASLNGLILNRFGQKDARGEWKLAFSDGDLRDTAAYYLGVVQGRGDGIFDPDGLITRQEAAVMLTRAYGAIGGTLPEDPSASAFPDEDTIAAYAKKSAAALASWQVMKGMEDGAFQPDGNYSVEQCIATFLRLYENAPVSSKGGKVTPLFTYEEAMAYLASISGAKGDEVGYRETVRLEGPLATFLRLDWGGGTMHADSLLYLVSRDGGVKRLDIGLCDGEYRQISPGLKLENLSFSKAGESFSCTVKFPYDVPYPSSPGSASPAHPKGRYHITVDVDTGRPQVLREDLP